MESSASPEATPRDGCAACGSVVQHDAACDRCGATGPLPSPDGKQNPSPGDVVQSRYEILRRAGFSLMGPWYLAFDRVEKQQVLLRALPGSLLREELTLTRLVADTRQALALHDDAIAAPARVVLTEPWSYLVESAPTGEPLSARLRRGLSVAEATKILDRLLETIRWAHLHAAVHGGLDLGEVWIKSDDKLEVRGFGQGALLARVLGTDTPPTAPLAAPELYRSACPVQTSDVYNLSAIAYSLLAGQPPFVGGDVANRIKHEQPPDVRTLRPETPMPLAGAIRRGMMKPQSERFPTAGDMIVAVRLAARTIARPESAS